MQPLGFEGKRKLSDLLSESKLTAAARARLPIVCDLVGPIWAPCVCLDERVRASKESKSTVILRFGRTPLPGQEELATR
jgi:tRNA(Ile)-lysidine synthetase-like protein